MRSGLRPHADLTRRGERKRAGGARSRQRDHAGQLVDVRSNLASYAVVGIADNSPIASYNLRAPFSGGPQAPAIGAFASSVLAAPSTSAGVLAINSLYTQSLPLGSLGDGNWFLGSTTNGQGMNGTFNGTDLTPGAAFNGLGTLPSYRLGGGGAILYVGLYSGATGSVPNQLTGAANLVIGAPLVNGSGATPSQGTEHQLGRPQSARPEQVCPRLGRSAGLDKLGTRAYQVLVPEDSSSASAAETMEQLCRLGL
jgi:hypothetical protein